MEPAGYPKSTLNAVNRYRNRGRYTFEDVYPIFDSAPVIHISFNDPSNYEARSYPYILPMFGCTGSYNQDLAERAIYLHGYISSKFFRKSDESKDHKGLSICVSATLLDGLVLALTPNHHSCNYRSAIAYGYAHLVTDEGERSYAMELITNNILPGRWANTRIPPTKAELAATGIVRVDIEAAIWTGVIPSWTHWGTPVAAPTDRMDGVPGYIGNWIREVNEKSEEYAFGAAKPV
ncbi:pyridoxamine 5'-phosphate oxidase-domain-containing protein [Aspergillus leporis]|uniref:Pyridoxamine 5'-phosphate oxidase-domain-containing protein n=1 Tax=Aspergillus leporis TaxID=41062 RepID=A0A5N5WNS1_9EURO|nr:pyridoxamine 5'-phosphate oxidase-domain-containing protein [Aspergillus leporis]